MEKERATENTLFWDQNDTPVSQRFDDPYYSKVSGRDEARHVFINGNKVVERASRKPAFKIAELGFGTGLNFYETLHALTSASCSPDHLSFASFELYPLGKEDYEKALSPWPEITKIAEPWLDLLPAAPGVHKISNGPVTLHLHIGDANKLVPLMPEGVDAWYLDGFSPDKNPELWSDELLCAVSQKTLDGGTFATYTAAGWVRRRLESHGFDVERIKGFGTKRHMSIGTKKSIR